MARLFVIMGDYRDGGEVCAKSPVQPLRSCELLGHHKSFPASRSTCAVRRVVSGWPAPRRPLLPAVLPPGLGCWHNTWILFPISVNTPPYPALLIIFAIFPSLPDLDQAPTERRDVVVHDGTWPVKGLLTLCNPSPSFFFALYLSYQL